MVSSALWHSTLYAAGDAPNTPNIVIVLADDLGWNDVGWHGSNIPTPRLDQLAHEGLQLNRFYTAPMCSPTRASLLTGLHGFKTGVTGKVIKPDDPGGLSTEYTLLPEVLQEAGYYTAIIGKWHLGHADPMYLPRQRGFDWQYGHYLGWIDYFTHTQNGIADWFRNGAPVDEEGYATDLLAQEAARLIAGHEFQRRPLFLYLPFNAPHGPLQAKPQDVQAVRAMNLNGLEAGRLLYAAQVLALDRAVGTVVDALIARGVWEETVFLFFSDNGGAHRRPHEHGSNTPLIGQKGELFDGGIRVPALLHFPRLAMQPEIVETIFHVVDVMPTVLSLAQVGEIPNVDGEDMVRAIQEGRTRREHLLLYADDRSGAMIDRQYKVIINPRRRVPRPFRNQMIAFDMSQGLPERKDNASFAPALAMPMGQRLRREVRPFLPGWPFGGGRKR
jgi:arylsulfatase A-like enzyme